MSLCCAALCDDTGGFCSCRKRIWIRPWRFSLVTARRWSFLGRMIPLVRSLISLPAGLTRMPLRRFITLTALGSAIWNAILCGAGVLLGQNWESMLVLADRYEDLVLTALALVMVIWLGRCHLASRGLARPPQTPRSLDSWGRGCADREPQPVWRETDTGHVQSLRKPKRITAYESSPVSSAFSLANRFQRVPKHMNASIVCERWRYLRLIP